MRFMWAALRSCMTRGTSGGDVAMKLNETPFLSAEALLARVPAPGVDVKAWRRNEEVIVRALDDQVLLRQDDRIVELDLVPESGALQHYAVSPGALWFLSALKPNAVYLRYVHPQRVLDDFDVALVVDTRTAESLRQLGVVDSVDIQDSISWLQEEFLCEVLGRKKVRVFMPMRERPDERRFQLLGRKHILELSKDPQGVMWVEKITASPINTDIAWILAEGDVRFIDHALGLENANVDSGDRLDTVTSTFGTYLDLWKTYGEREWQRTVKRAAQIQSIPYTSCRPLSDEGGGWRLFGDPEAMRGMEQRWREVADDDDQMEVSDLAPDWQSERYIDLSTRDKQSKLSCKPKWRDGGVILKTDSIKAPPDSGYLYLSVTGDRTQQARRIKARQFIEAGRGVPGLRSLLQDQTMPSVRASKLPGLSPYSRESFRSGRATDKQEEALRVALNTPDVALIIGPPGTGKTQVIAALERRLSELNEGKSIAQDVLISSFQHDAVENALERTDVYGLPAVKVGNARRRSGTDTVEGWRHAKHEGVKLRLNELIAAKPEQALLQELGHLISDLLIFGAMPEVRAMSLSRVTELLDELVERARIRVPSAWTDRWEDAVDTANSEACMFPTLVLDAGHKKNLRRVVRAIRLTPEGAFDDGRVRLMDVRARLGVHPELLDDADMKLLDDICLFDNMSDAVLLSLRNLQARLLDRLTTDVRTHEERRQLPDALRGLLKELRQIIQEKLSLTSHGRAMVMERYADALRWQPNRVRAAVEQYSSIVGATCQQSASRQMALLKGGGEDSLDSLRFSSVIIDEAARANPLDLFVPMALAKRRIVLVGDPRQLPHLLDADIEEEIRAERGEQINSDVYKSSLFERLWRQFQKREATDGFSRVVMLDTQFRMHPRLGDFVSQQFYERPGLGRVESGRNESEFLENVPGLGRSVCSWLDVPHESGEESREGSSRLRSVEAGIVADEVVRLMQALPSDMSVGVITFYSAQRDAIHEALATPQRGITEHAADGWVIKPSIASNPACAERLRIGTVDAFQGKEFDVVILSTVRSNRFKLLTPDEGDPVAMEAFERQASGKFGHLRSANRLNVAMSRQKRYLLCIGDADMYRGAVASNAVPEMSAFLDLCETEARRVS